VLTAVAIAPGAAGAAAVAALTGALVLTVIAFCLIYALSKFYDSVLGYALRRFASAIDGAIPFGNPVGAVVGRVDDAVMAGFGRALDGLAGSTAHVFHALAWVVASLWDAVNDLGRATLQAVIGLKHGDVPTAITHRTAGLARRVAQLERGRESLVRRLTATVNARVGRLDAELDRTFGLARRGIDALRGDITTILRRGLTGVRGDLAALRRYTYGRLTRRISRLEAAVGAGVLTAAVLRVLARAMPWYRCANVKGFNKWLCKSPPGGLNNLLGLLLIFTTSLGVNEFARLLQEEMGMVTWVVREAVDDTPATGR
jgi:hypothetical protein